MAAILRSTAHPVGSQPFDPKTGYGVLDVAAALAAPTPGNDPGEPNDDVNQVKPGQLFSSGEPPLTTATLPSTRIAGTAVRDEDARDLYRIRVPAHRTVRVSISAAGAATAGIGRPRTLTVDEPPVLRKRDFAGASITGGAVGAYAYAEVQLAIGKLSRYVLSVTASRR